jgi:hypothetical protein
MAAQLYGTTPKAATCEQQSPLHTPAAYSSYMARRFLAHMQTALECPTWHPA